ncbi:MAG: oligosaccharide flippase family protein [Vulcanisaeta sp.]|jgi:O-antigen/teichoic acid export membrane protein
MGVVGKRTAASIFYGMIGKVVSSLIAFGGSIALARILGPGYYGLAYALVALPQALVGLVDVGLNGVIVRYGSRNEWNTALSAVILRIILIMSMAAVLLLLSRDIAYAFGRPYIVKFMPIVTLYFVLYSLDMLVSAVVGALGLFNIGNTTLIIRNAVRVTAAIILALLGFGAISVVWGLAIGYGLETVILTVIAVYKLRNYIVDFLRNLEAFVNGAREALLMIAPLIINVVVGSVLSPVVTTFQIRYADNVLLGNWNASTNVMSLLEGLAGVVGGGLTFGITASKDRDVINKAFVKGSMYSSLLIGFLATGAVVFSNPAMAVLYGNKYPYGGLMLMLQAFELFGVVFGQYGAYLWAVGDTRLMSITGILGSLIWSTSAISLILIYGGAWGFIYAAIVSSYLSGIVTLLLTYKIHKVLPDFKSNVRALIPSLIAGAVVYPFVNLLTPKPALLLIVPYTLLYMFFMALLLRKDELTELIRVSATDKVLSLVLIKPLTIILRINSVVYGRLYAQ